jgi:hypothetical protein
LHFCRMDTMVLLVIHAMVCEVRVCENHEIVEQTSSTFREKCSTAMSSTDDWKAEVIVGQ